MEVEEPYGMAAGQALFNFPLPSLGFPGIGRNRTDQTPAKVDKIIYDPPDIDYGKNDGVTEEVRALLRKYAPVIYCKAILVRTSTLR